MAQPDFQALANELTAISVEISRLPNLLVFNQHNTTLTQLREIQAEIRALHQSIRLEMQELRSGLRMDFQQLRTKMQQLRTEMRTELRINMQKMRAELCIEMRRIGAEVQKLCTEMEMDEAVKRGAKLRMNAESVPSSLQFLT